jgi:hypothetical protein
MTTVWSTHQFGPRYSEAAPNLVQFVHRGCQRHGVVVSSVLSMAEVNGAAAASVLSSSAQPHFRCSVSGGMQDTAGDSFLLRSRDRERAKLWAVRAKIKAV